MKKLLVLGCVCLLVLGMTAIGFAYEDEDDIYKRRKEWLGKVLLQQRAGEVGSVENPLGTDGIKVVEGPLTPWQVSIDASIEAAKNEMCERFGIAYDDIRDGESKVIGVFSPPCIPPFTSVTCRVTLFHGGIIYTYEVRDTYNPTTGEHETNKPRFIVAGPLTPPEEIDLTTLPEKDIEGSLTLPDGTVPPLDRYITNPPPTLEDYPSIHIPDTIIPPMVPIDPDAPPAEEYPSIRIPDVIIPPMVPIDPDAPAKIEEVLEINAIKAEVQAQANDPLFTGQMADQPTEILPLKGRGQGSE